MNLENKEDLSDQDIMHQYKVELSAIYQKAALKKASIHLKHLSSEELMIRRCNEDMRQDISDLKVKYGIHY